jgi:hypothetical protein
VRRFRNSARCFYDVLQVISSLQYLNLSKQACITDSLLMLTLAICGHARLRFMYITACESAGQDLSNESSVSRLDPNCGLVLLGSINFSILEG